MADWKVVFENRALRVETICAHPHLQVRVLLLGDPQLFVDGIRTEHRTEIACSSARAFLEFLRHFTADRTSADYEPRGRWEEGLTYGDTLGTQIIEYQELVEADPEGDYQITYTGRVTELANPQVVLVEHTTQFKASRADLVAIGETLARELRECCAAELALGRRQGSTEVRV